MQLETPHVLWLMADLCSIVRRPFDVSVAAQTFPGPHTLETFIKAAARYGLDVSPKKLRVEKLAAQNFTPLALQLDQAPARVLQADDHAVVLASGPYARHRMVWSRIWQPPRSARWCSPGT